jgi:membrane protein YdbS with pleckstrin-like domain
MRDRRIGYRIHMRFTVRRLMAAMVCFSLALGLVHDAEYVDWEVGETPWATWACIVALALLAFAVMVMQIVDTKNRWCGHRHG